MFQLVKYMEQFFYHYPSRCMKRYPLGKTNCSSHNWIPILKQGKRHGEDVFWEIPQTWRTWKFHHNCQTLEEITLFVNSSAAEVVQEQMKAYNEFLIKIHTSFGSWERQLIKIIFGLYKFMSRNKEFAIEQVTGN